MVVCLFKNFFLMVSLFFFLTFSSFSFGQEESESSELVYLSVSKSDRKAELSILPKPGGQARLISSYPVAFGKEDGDKVRQGDNRTPEGVYFTLHHIDGSQLPAKYGSYAIPLDFPNPIDINDGKTGYGIWLHGVDNASRIEAARVTEGCVAFYNQDIYTLSKWLRPYQGVVVITPDKTLMNKKEDVLNVARLTKDWANSWANRKLDNYLSYYHEKFMFLAKSLAQFSRYKKRVFQSYKKMTLRFDDIRVITHPKYAVSFMNQDFNGDNRFISVGRKILYWSRTGDGSYQILRESFQNNRFEKVGIKTTEPTLTSSEVLKKKV